MGLSWTYVLTGDEILFDEFQAPNGSFYWTNTHFLDVALGLELGF